MLKKGGGNLAPPSPHSSYAPQTFGNKTPIIDENTETANEGKILLWLAF